MCANTITTHMIHIKKKVKVNSLDTEVIKLHTMQQKHYSVLDV